MLDKSVSDLVSSYINFNYGLNSKGWSRCYCEVCGDGSRKKGPRGGWAFDGDMAFYHCFNCGIDGNFDPDREHPFSKEMRRIFDGFGIPKTEYNALAYAKKFANRNAGDAKKPETKFVSVQTHDIPDHFYPLADAPLSNQLANDARKFLREKYALSQDDYPFFLSTGKVAKDADIRDSAHAKALAGRIIIPFFKHGRLVYYQGRSMEKNPAKKYLNMEVPKTNVIFNMDALYRNFDRPLYIFEGAFDAIHVDGVAVMENNMTSNQIELLNRSPRQKIIVPDRKADSKKLVQQGIDLGWGVAIPEIGSGCKDLCEGILRFGKLHVLNSLVKKTYTGQEAKLRASFV